MSPPAGELLDVRDLTFRYDEKVVLRNCSFSVRRQERLAILGTSGCGKSTLLRLLLGLLRPDGGTIRFEDRDIAGLPGNELNAVRQKIGMVFQSAALISSINVHENLALPLTELTDKPPEEVDRIVDEKLRMVGMQDTKSKLPSELSGGMRKRVSIARALVMEPQMILFDEPSTGLDPVGTALIDELIMGLSEETTTCIVVTHNLTSAFRIATRVAMLHDGAILEEGRPDDFRRSTNPIVHQFVNGDPKGPLSQERNHEPSKG
jgi:phospholipid/cholesterol/gamma-HCH transport system ATP-binding protein